MRGKQKKKEKNIFAKIAHKQHEKKMVASQLRNQDCNCKMCRVTVYYDGLCDRVLTGHLADYGVEIGLILVVDESVVEHPLALMAEETEDMVFVSNLTRLTLQYTWSSREER